MCNMHLMHEEPYKIAIIDAGLIGRKKRRFLNLVCMKLSGYWKEKDAHVRKNLIENLFNISKTDIKINALKQDI